MASNRGVAYVKPGVVELQSIDFPKLYDPARKKKIQHGVILKIISTNICGSDQHMVRGRTSAPPGMVLGHEITGEVIEKGSDVEMIALGDLEWRRKRLPEAAALYHQALARANEANDRASTANTLRAGCGL